MLVTKINTLHIKQSVRVVHFTMKKRRRIKGFLSLFLLYYKEGERVKRKGIVSRQTGNHLIVLKLHPFV